MLQAKLQVLTFIIGTHILAVSAQTWLRADGSKDAYALINKVFGAGAVEVPDCLHKVKHITMANDSNLKRQVFLFHIHVDQDGDTCSKTDRQRTEIKTSPDKLKGFRDETVFYTWNFKLDAAFQPSESFTHIHQLKDVGGKSGTPILTISPRKGKSGAPDSLQIIHVDDSGKKTVIGDTPLAPFKGNWVHVETKTKIATKGSYSVKITKVSDGSKLFSVDKKNLDTWRTGAEYVRPKWGIYRGIDRKAQLRDEIVRFDSFCLDKGQNRCT